MQMVRTVEDGSSWVRRLKSFFEFSILVRDILRVAVENCVLFNRANGIDKND